MPSRTFPAWPASVADARRYVGELLGSVPPDLCRTATLLVSELATNVLLHTTSAEFAVEIRTAAGEGTVWVGVTDSGRGLPVVRSPSAVVERGRGVQLVATLADRWGARRRRAGTEKTVWFELSYEPRALPG